jgi:hypothetical protein
LQLSFKRRNFKVSKFILENIKGCLLNKKIPRAHIASPISNFPIEGNKELYVVEEILNIALPILSKMTRPALYLPGKLQAVVKAHRIYLKPGEEYNASWQLDGKHENIIAVVIYFYRVSKQLIGGDIEFLDKTPIKEALIVNLDEEDDYTTKNLKEDMSELPYCRISVKTGTLLVYSNYQMIHRELRMTCNGVDTNSHDGWASRDYLLFYIIDQSKPLLSTKTDLINSGDRLEIKNTMLKNQIKPSGLFVPDTQFVNTADFDLQIGWINELEYNFEEALSVYEGELEGLKNVKLLNDSPPMNRGISWVFEQSSKNNS